MFFGGADRVCDFQFFFMQRFHDRSMMMNAYNYSNHLNLINKYIYIIYLKNTFMFSYMRKCIFTCMYLHISLTPFKSTYSRSFKTVIFDCGTASESLRLSQVVFH